MKKADIEAALAAGETEFVVKRSAFRSLPYYSKPVSEISDGNFIGCVERWGDGWKFHFTENHSGNATFHYIESLDIICTLSQYEERQREAEAVKDERKRRAEFRADQDAAAVAAPEALALIAEYEAIEAECADWFNRTSATLANEAKIVASNAPVGGTTYMIDVCHSQTKTAYTALTVCRTVLAALRRGGIPHVARMALSGVIDPTDELSERAMKAADQWIKQAVYSDALNTPSESAVKEETAAVVAFLRREADNYGERGTVPDVLGAAAYCIEHGDHHR